MITTITLARSSAMDPILGHKFCASLAACTRAECFTRHGYVQPSDTADTLAEADRRVVTSLHAWE